METAEIVEVVRLVVFLIEKVAPLLATGPPKLKDALKRISKKL